MTKKEANPTPPGDLRRQAEKTARERVDQLPRQPEALSREETAHVLHELRVHQVELEMQNDELRRSQVELIATQARYFDLYDLAPVGYCTVDEPGLILEANLTVANLLGVTRGALVKQPFTRFVVPDDQDLYYRHRKRLFGTGEPQACDLRLVREGRARFWAHLATTTAQDSDGVPICRAVVSDISERKFREDERELTARLVLLVNTPGGLREHMSELTAALQSWSGCEAVGIRLRTGDDYPYFETRGFPPDFVAGETYLCAQDPAGELLRDESGKPVLECMCGNVLAGRTNPELPFFTRSGSFWTNSTTTLLATATEGDRQGRTRNRCNSEGYESVALIPLRTEGEVFGLLQFNDRRTDRFTPTLIAHFETMADSLAISLSRRQATEALAASRNLLRSVVDNVPIRVFWKDAELRYLGCNAAFARDAGMSCPEDLIGKDDLQMAWREQAEAYRADDRRVMDSDAPSIGFEEPQTTPDGRTIWLRTSKVPLHDAEGGVIGVLGIYDDITERRQLEAQLQQAQKMESVGRLAGGVAHDFNNMLGVIIGHAELAMDGTDPHLPLFADLQEIHKAAARSADLTGQLLAFARKQTVAPRVLDLNETVEGMLKMLRRLTSERVELNWRPAADLWPVRMDPSQIDQILANLCVNARDSIDDIGAITIEIGNTTLDEDFCSSHVGAVVGDYVRVAVSDNGCGMDAATLGNIFEPFFTTKEMGRGTGLGLATVYGIVKQNAGCIHAYSEPNMGTTFRIYLPRHVAAREKVGAEGTTGPSPRGQETILLAEDEPGVLRMAAKMLTAQGYTVLPADTPGEAIRLAREYAGEIHLLMADVIMPEMNGRDLARNVLAIRPGIKRLFMSGYTADVIAHHGVLDQGVHFIQKPFSRKALANKVRNVLDHE